MICLLEGKKSTIICHTDFHPHPLKLTVHILKEASGDLACNIWCADDSIAVFLKENEIHLKDKSIPVQFK